MIGTIITIIGGVYVGLFIAKKGGSFDKAVKPLCTAGKWARKKCCKSRNSNEHIEFEQNFERDWFGDQNKPQNPNERG